MLEIDVEAGRLTAVAATEQAMRDGAEVVYQAAFLDLDGWAGYARLPHAHRRARRLLPAARGRCPN